MWWNLPLFPFATKHCPCCLCASQVHVDISFLFYIFRISRIHKFDRAKVRIIMCCHSEEMELNVLALFLLLSVCVLLLSRRYTRSTICDEWYFRIEPGETMEQRYFRREATGNALRKTFNIFCCSVPDSLGECEAEYRMNLTAFFAFQSGKKLASNKCHTWWKGMARPTWGLQEESSRWQMFAFSQQQKIKKLLTSVLQTKICSHSCEFYSRSVSLHIGMKGNNKK